MTCPVYATVLANTGQVTFYNTRPCITVHSLDAFAFGNLVEIKQVFRSLSRSAKANSNKGRIGRGGRDILLYFYL